MIYLNPTHFKCAKNNTFLSRLAYLLLLVCNLSRWLVFLDLTGHTECAEHSECFLFKDLISLLALWALCEIENARKGIPLERMGRKATDLNPGGTDKVAELPGGNGSLYWLHLAWQLPIDATMEVLFCHVFNMSAKIYRTNSL